MYKVFGSSKLFRRYQMVLSEAASRRRTNNKYKGKKKNDKRADNDLQIPTQKTQDPATQTPLNHFIIALSFKRRFMFGIYTNVYISMIYILILNNEI